MGLDYRFFGKLFLEPPEKLLSINDLERLRDLEPLLRRLEERQGMITTTLLTVYLNTNKKDYSSCRIRL